MDYKKLIHRLIDMESLEKYYNSGYSGIYSDAITAITDLLVENQSLRNAANGFKASAEAAEARCKALEKMVNENERK